MSAPKILSMVLAGGEGRRLEPLTRDRAKPAVPFGGRYRIIDFVLSNLVNSGFVRIKILTQYKSESLNSHLSRAWHLSNVLGNFIEAVPAQMRTGPDWYKGSADAIYQNLNLITDEEPDHVLVFGADHVYRMDVRQMLDQHVATGAHCTIAAIPVPLSEAHQFGICKVDPDGRLVEFLEKPKNPPPMPGRPDMALASMGNYLFKTDTLVREVTRDAARGGAHDFGRSIISEFFRENRVMVYDFATNVVPGQTERERGYWRDVGTVEALYASNMDLVDVDPVFSLYNARWPIHTMQYDAPPAKFVFSDREGGRVGFATDSLISEGCVISGGHLHRSILGPKVRINSYSDVSDSLLFEGVEIGRHARIRRAIVDKGVYIPPHTEIGYDPEADRRRFPVSETGIVVIPKGMRLE
jgi:glucose-1-phosphate adenylyltransferase